VIGVLVVDDHPVVLAGLAALIGSDPQLRLTATARCANEALSLDALIFAAPAGATSSSTVRWTIAPGSTGSAPAVCVMRSPRQERDHPLRRVSQSTTSRATASTNQRW
jgi:hypothetical protein